MFLKISVLVAAILQVVAPALLSIGTFEMSNRSLEVFIQPAGWAFSIWGLIYTLSFVYAVYQLIPRYDNELLRATRIPALIGFLGSIAWLYFAGMSGWEVWLTIPILFLMAISFIYVIRATNSADKNQTLLSKKILFPYAAWTGIASWLNIQAVLNERGVVTSETLNLVTNGILFACIALFTLYFFRKTGYSAWYGGVMVWAGIGIVSANLNSGSTLFVALGGVLIAVVLVLYYKE
jgi:hypothetical protein